MSSKTKNIIGYSILFLLFGFLTNIGFIFGYWWIGYLATGCTIVIVSLVILACYLMFGKTE